MRAVAVLVAPSFITGWLRALIPATVGFGAFAIKLGAGRSQHFAPFFQTFWRHLLPRQTFIQPRNTLSCDLTAAKVVARRLAVCALNYKALF